MDLTKLLTYAFENTRYYHNCLANKSKDISTISLSDFPILYRHLLVENKGDIMSKEFYHYDFPDFYVASTSGTTGMPVNIYWDHPDYILSNLTLWRLRKSFYSITPQMKVIKFTNNSEQVVSINNNVMQISKHYIVTCFYEIADAINKYGPVWTQVQPSTLDLLLDQYEINPHIKPPKSITYVETFGEMQSDSLKKKFNNVFRNAILGNMYGTEECNTIAFQCPCGKLHVISDNVHIEIEKDTPGNLLVTNLYNRAMPIIRYSTGDLVTISTSKCLCGWQGQTIDIIHGRVTDIIKIQDKNFQDRFLSEYTLSHYIYLINNTLNHPIAQYKFKYYQKTKTLHCIFVLSSGQLAWKNRIIELFNKYLSRDYNMMKNVTYELSDQRFILNENKYRIVEVCDL